MCVDYSRVRGKKYAKTDLRPFLVQNKLLFIKVSHMNFEVAWHFCENPGVTCVAMEICETDEAGGLFSNMADFHGHRHHEFLIRFLIGWNLWRPSWIWKTIESIVLQTIAYCLSRLLIGPIFKTPSWIWKTIESIVLETIAHCLSRLLIGYGSYEPGIVVCCHQ